MNHGRSIRLYLVDGTPNGLLTAEIVNWTGHVLTSPRSKLSELVQRPECSRTGVYFLVGENPDNPLRPKVYIGESDDVATRLKQHNRDESKGGKDFWEKVCFVTSKDHNLTKAHVKHLESLLIQIAKSLGHCELVNGTAHEYSNLPESDKADMAYFIEQIRTVLPVLGFSFLREAAKPSSIVLNQPASTNKVSPRFEYSVAKHQLRAFAQEVDGEFFVLKGANAKRWFGAEHGYARLQQQLIDDGVLLAVNDGEQFVFQDDYAFTSPSAAAAVISGRNANGRVVWVVEKTKQSYGEWQEEQINLVTTPIMQASPLVSAEGVEL